jgi:hypothetical protein
MATVSEPWALPLPPALRWLEDAVYAQAVADARRVHRVLTAIVARGHYTADDLQVVLLSPLLGTDCYICARSEQPPVSCRRS